MFFGELKCGIFHKSSTSILFTNCIQIKWFCCAVCMSKSYTWDLLLYIHTKKSGVQCSHRRSRASLSPLRPCHHHIVSLRSRYSILLNFLLKYFLLFFFVFHSYALMILSAKYTTILHAITNFYVHKFCLVLQKLQIVCFVTITTYYDRDVQIHT